MESLWNGLRPRRPAEWDADPATLFPAAIGADSRLLVAHPRRIPRTGYVACEFVLVSPLASGRVAGATQGFGSTPVGRARMHSIDQEEFSALIGLFYDAALDPVAWQGVGATLARVFNSESCTVQVRHHHSVHATLLCATANFDAEIAANYEAHLHQNDPWVTAATSVVWRGSFVGQQLVDDHAILNSEFYQECCRHQGVFNIVGCVFSSGSTASTGVGIHRPHGRPGFTVRERALLDLLVPHLNKAIRLHLRLRTLEYRSRLGFDALDGLAIGVILVGSRGRTLFSNRVAERIVNGGQGLTVRHGFLRATATGKDQALQKAIANALAMTEGGFITVENVLTLPRSDSQRPLSVLVSPVRPDAIGIDLLQPAAMIFIGDGDAPPTSSKAALASLYRLTPAEARLTLALLQGERLQDYALRVGIHAQTAKAQLKQVFAKTGHSRQADLVRELTADPVIHLAEPWGGRRDWPRGDV